MSVQRTVARLMRESPELYSLRPWCYEHREKLTLHVSAVLHRPVTPEAVTRAQRREFRKIDDGTYTYEDGKE